MERKIFSTGSRWEEKYGYSRAVKVGNLVFTSGTVAVNEQGELVGKNDSYTQTLFALEKIEKALKQADAGKENIVRSRIYVTNIDDQDEVGRAHKEFFGGIKPCLTMIEISRLAEPEFLVEVEVEAVFD